MNHREKPPGGIKWQDLTLVSAHQTATEILLPLPWLILPWGLYASPAWYLGPVAGFVFFLCALRLNHERRFDGHARAERADAGRKPRGGV